MAGVVPTITADTSGATDSRDKPGHDGRNERWRKVTIRAVDILNDENR
jgi:hypothetical protein